MAGLTSNSVYARMNGTVIVTAERSGRTKSSRCAELLDHAEDVVPAARIQARRVLAQLVEDLVHLERGQDRLDQDGRADRPARDAERVLRMQEDVVPEPCLEVALELGQVEVGARAALEQRAGRCGTGRARSRTASPRSARRRRARASRGGASRAGGRGAWRSRRSSCSACRPCSNEIVRSTASIRLRWPSTQFAQVGEFASSKSAMKTLAPELSALMTILRSAGPVISTRRSCRSAGASRDPPVVLAHVARFGRKSAARPRAAVPAARPERRAAPRAGSEPALEVGDEVERVVGEDLLVALAAERDACRQIGHRRRTLAARRCEDRGA